MYSVAHYGRMIADKVRMDAYAEALRRSVRPGSVVLDIGTGTGIMALLACRYGARKVFAIEPGNAIQVAREIAAANGFADRIEFIQAASTDVSLPERADVMVSDLRGVLSFHQKHLLVIADARERFLTPGGILIPARDTLWAALVEAPDLYSDQVAPAQSDGFAFHWDAAWRFACNIWGKAHVLPTHLLVEPLCWATIDYSSVRSPDASGECSWTVTRAGTAHGFALWFDTALVEGIGFSNGPEAPEAIYGQAFFPFPEPVALVAGDAVKLGLHADLIAGEYLWRWTTRVSDGTRAAEVKKEFAQSTFYGEPLSAAQLGKQAASHVPQFNDDGEIDYWILGLFRTGVALGEIARRLVAQFPGKFASEPEALTRVAELSLKYSR